MQRMIAPRVCRRLVEEPDRRQLNHWPAHLANSAAPATVIFYI